jgi:hypothetical protein
MSEYAAQEREYLLQTLSRVSREYLDLRVAHLYRARVDLRGRIEDLLHQLAESLKGVFRGAKSFGPERVQVVDIVFSDDWRRRRAILTPTDQNTIVNEVMERADEQKGKTATTTPINSVRALYAHFDKALEPIVETLQTFQWVDLPDAFDAANVEVACHYIGQILRVQGIPDPLRESFNRALNRPDSQGVELEEAMLLFYHRARLNIESFSNRRELEPAHNVALAREPVPGAAEEINGLIVAYATRLQSAAQIQKAGDLSSDQRAAAAKALGVAPEQATAEWFLAFEAAHLSKDLKALAEKLLRRETGGQPFDYKRRQLSEFRKKLEGIAKQLKGIGIDLEKDAPKPKPKD